MEAVAQSALAVTRVVIGEAPPELPATVANEVGTETVWLVAKWQSRFWRSINVQACEPREGMLFLSVKLAERFMVV